MAKQIVIDLSNADMRALEHDLLDVDKWVQDAVAAKVAACRGRMVADAVRVLTDDTAVADMPAKPERLIAELVKRPDYKNRKQRDRDEEAEARRKYEEALKAAQAPQDALGTVGKAPEQPKK